MNLSVTKENYKEKRQELVELNSNLLGIVLRDKEVELNRKLAELKKELLEDCNGEIPYDMPVLRDKRLYESRLYKFCSMMPKGADLHVHDMSELPVSELIKVLLTREDLYIDVEAKGHSLANVFEGQTAPKGYVLFREAYEKSLVKEEELIKDWTLEGTADSGKNVWDFFEELFVRHAAISENDDFAYAYYVHAFKYYLEHGINHIEIHILLSGKMMQCAATVRTVRQAYYDVKKEYPQLSVRMIGAGMKDDDSNLSISKTSFMNTVYVQSVIKDESDPEHICDFVIGYDLINEEDVSLPMKDFASMLIDLNYYYPDMKLYVHCGESLDAENDNLIDAYLLGASRVGHGMNLYRYPDLLSRYANSEICLEMCVISNQTLGYTSDVRVHPGTEYLRRGVAVALCSDDPTYQEHETLTDDFFAATVAWNLDIADLKQLALNSLVYSGLDNYSKQKALKYFNRNWQEFIDKALSFF